MTKTTLLIASISIVAALTVAFPLGLVDAISEKARIVDKGEVITLRVTPAEDIDGIFFTGYGIFTSGTGGADSGTMLVITKHGGVYDSQEQSSPADEVWHSHYVELIQQDECISDANESGLAVNPLRISWSEPGNVFVTEEKIILRNAPTSDYDDINYFAFLFPAAGLPTNNIQEYSLSDFGDGQVVKFGLSLGEHGFADAEAGIPNGVCVDSVTPINTKLVTKDW